jgi:crotonobetainyl-CoA:carnitine CoA-transferase CaiB-like acyl-CoA transferase
MDRLGLGYEALNKLNPRLIYCAITGYGQHGPRADVAAHDLNYIAEAGLLALAAGADGAPVLPPALIADIGGGTYPAVINILLALRERERTGKGCKLDIAMADNLFAFMYWALGNGLVAGQWPKPGGELVTGGSPRFNVYRTKDNKFVAAAPLESKFWENFCALIELVPEFQDDRRDPAASKRAVADKIAAKTADEWRALFEGKDVCCCIVGTLEKALRDPHFIARGVFAAKLAADGKEITALPVPVVPQFRAQLDVAGYPALGEANAEMLGEARGERREE